MSHSLPLLLPIFYAQNVSEYAAKEKQVVGSTPPSSQKSYYVQHW